MIILQSMMRYQKIFFTLISLLFLLSQNLFATHNRAGEIIYQVIAPFTIKATVITYTKTSGGSLQADRDQLIITWGDGSNDDTISRTNGPINGNGFPDGVYLNTDIKKNTYTGIHTYPGAAPPPNNFYIITMQDLNRIGNIINIQSGSSINVPFYIEDTLKFPTDLTNIGFNSSPILLNPPIDYANVGDTFYHNPLAYDPDGDSITFDLIVPLQFTGTVVPGYQYPQQIIPGVDNKFTINRSTGELLWAVPKQAGIYNIAILIHEFRRGYCLGSMIRDMQILVDAQNNQPPQIADVKDTCIRAGDVLRIKVTATDPDAGQIVTLTGDGGPFQFAPALSPATFPQAQGNPVSSNFNWQTICDHIRGQFYTVVFKAQDNYVSPANQSIPLTDLETWLIDVIAPPPLNLVATATSNKVTLNWDAYKCASFGNFRGFSIWKRVGSNPFVPAYCETGLAGRGYVKIADKVQTNSYVDLDVVRGQESCYRILAHFSKKTPNGIYEYDLVVSVPSNESCVFLPFDVPVITKVSVKTTDVTIGQMQVEWIKPRTGGTNLDTVLNPPPYRFDLYRGNGFNFSNATLINSISRPAFYLLNDTTFTDTNLNTQDNPYSYKVAFYSQTDSIGETNLASSVYLSVAPTDQTLKLSWDYKTPWLQDTFQIFKLNKLTSTYDYLATTDVKQYADTALENDSTYCYFVRAFGHYSSPLIGRPLINDSEIKCGVPKDTVPPCPPLLNVTNDCDAHSGETWDTSSYVNHLKWHNFTDSCGSDAVKYHIYYATDSTSFRFIDSINNILDTTYDHVLENNLAGCYAVTAIDRVGNESAKKNVVCIDNCPYYTLPNTFTPNGDKQNDFFTPFKPYRFISRIEMKIFNRWGDKVFETTDPEILWNGDDQKTGKPCSEGVYLYAGFYYEKRFNGEVKRPLPQGKGGGFIHLLRGK